MSFQITIENFEGPIDALLQLIEKRKMAISDISLATITDDYIKFIADLDDVSMSDMTHFIFVASTLTLIKSKALLPNLELTEEEEGDIEELKRRIELFRVYQEAALTLKESYSPTRSHYYPKTRKKERYFNPDPKVNKEILSTMLTEMFHQTPKKPVVRKEATLRIAVHIEDMMNSLEERISKKINFGFRSFLQDYLKRASTPKERKIYSVVGFLAMLELVKKSSLDVNQAENFEDIFINNES